MSLQWGPDFSSGKTACEVTAISQQASELRLTTTRGVLVAGNLIACAGLQADRVARLTGDPGVERIVPFRGDYYTLVPSARSLVRGLIYPVPDPELPFQLRGVDPGAAGALAVTTSDPTAPLATSPVPPPLSAPSDGPPCLHCGGRTVLTRPPGSRASRAMACDSNGLRTVGSRPICMCAPICGPKSPVRSITIWLTWAKSG